MIAVFVLGIGLLGLAHLQITTLKHNESAYFRSQASIFASDMFERMRANQTAAIAGNYNITMAVVAPDAPFATIDKADIAEWLGDLASFLPDGDGAINCDPCDAGAVHTVTIEWTEVQDKGSRGTTRFDYTGAL